MTPWFMHKAQTGLPGLTFRHHDELWNQFRAINQVPDKFIYFHYPDLIFFRHLSYDSYQCHKYLSIHLNAHDIPVISPKVHLHILLLHMVWVSLWVIHLMYFSITNQFCEQNDVMGSRDQADNHTNIWREQGCNLFKPTIFPSRLFPVTDSNLYVRVSPQRARPTGPPNEHAPQCADAVSFGALPGP
jgi:hypothetical protein